MTRRYHRATVGRRVPAPAIAALVAALAFAVAGCASNKLWMRAGGSAIEAEGEEQDCAAQSEGGSSVSFSSDGLGTPAPVDAFSKRYGCLRSRGYKLVPVTGEESDKLRGLSGEAKEAYWQDLMTKYGLQSSSPAPAAPVPVAPAAPARR